MSEHTNDSLQQKSSASTIEFLTALFRNVAATVNLLVLSPKSLAKSGERSLAKPITVTITQIKDDPVLLEQLRAHNKKYGIYYIVNSGGTKVKQITHFNAFFAEMDHVTKDEQLRRYKAAPIQPSALVETDRSIHAYWFINGDCSAEEWKEIQQRLIDYFDGDGAIKNPNRAMRLPGFNHVSAAEDGSLRYKMVECLHLDQSIRYTAQQMRDAFNDKEIAVTILSRNWGNDKRHHLTLYLSGAFAHDGYSRDETEETILDVCKRSVDPETDDRRRAIQDTFDKFENHEEVGGWNKIGEEDLLEQKVIKRLRARLGRKPSARKRTKTSIPDVVREILLIITVFLTETKEVFVTYPTDRDMQTRDLDSREFCGWLRNYFFENYDHILDSGTLKNILFLLAHKAQLTDQKVYLRVAKREDGTIYIDLNNAAGEVVELDAEGWEIIKDPPVIFRQGSGSKPFPRPERDGRIEGLFKFVNLRSDGERLLFLTWFIAALMGDPPYPILVLQAEQSSGKSVITKLSHEMIDPNVAVRRSKPMNLTDLIVAAYNNHMIEMDNISTLPGWLSDGLCQLATGGAFAKRILYSDLAEITFSAARPILVSGIVDPTSRADFLDRAIIIRPPRITDNRREESEMWAEFHQEQGRLFGAVLDVLSNALKHLPNVPKPVDSPRMINFARLGVAVERALNWESGLFERAYKESRDLAMEKALETSSVAQAIINFMAKRETWRGKAGKLWSELNEWMPWHQRPSDWPRSHKGMSDALNRLAPALRNFGIEILRSEKPTKNSFIYTLKRTELWDDANVTEGEGLIEGLNFLNNRKE